jgi:hypothetical protein
VSLHFAARAPKHSVCCCTLQHVLQNTTRVAAHCSTCSKTQRVSLHIATRAPKYNVCRCTLQHVLQNTTWVCASLKLEQGSNPSGIVWCCFQSGIRLTSISDVHLSLRILPRSRVADDFDAQAHVTAAVQTEVGGSGATDSGSSSHSEGGGVTVAAAENGAVWM